MVSICLELISGIPTEDVIIEVMILGDGGMSGCKLNLLFFFFFFFFDEKHSI